MSKLVCEKCGGKNIQVLAWVDANTHKYKGEGPCIDTDSNWCEDCKAHVYITDEEVYLENLNFTEEDE